MTVGNATISLPPRPSWVRGACAALLLTVLYITATETLGTLPALVLPSEYHLLRGVVASAGMGVVAALTLVVGFEVLLANRRRDLRPYGIARPTRVWSSIGIALAAYFPIVIVGFALSSALGLGGTTTPDVGHQSNGAKVAISFLVIVVAPWLEEVSIRGMLFSSLAGRFGFWLAAGLSGFLWASAHLVGGVLIPFTMLGMLLAFVRWRTGSVLPGMILHGTQNSLAAAVGAGVGWYMAPMPFVLAATIGLTWRWLPRDGSAG
ncbi:MAG: lysostaphin resistance A-like protein [Gaiellales bacterium]